MAQCIDCREDKKIRAQARCGTCYGRFYFSPDFTQVAVQNQARHRLSDVDPDTRTATCAICGPVGVTAIKDYREVTGYRCNVARARLQRTVRARRRTSSAAKAA